MERGGEIMPWQKGVWLFVVMISVGVALFIVVCHFTNPKGR